MTDKLPAEFFAQPEGAIGEESLKLIYAETIARLQDENPDADMLETMMMERVAFLYVHIRYKETKQLFAHDRAYKETLQLWTSMAAQLQKKRASEVELGEFRDEILGSVQSAINGALKVVPPEVAEQFKEKLGDELELAGI